jgi:hypothetical protein
MDSLNMRWTYAKIKTGRRAFLDHHFKTYEAPRLAGELD